MPLMTSNRQSNSYQRGVSMLEVLISLVLITSALLGATALQMTGLHTNRSAYYRSQASLLAYDFADRLRINATYALGDADRYEINTASGSAPSSPSCITDTNGCSESNLRDQDLREWSEHFFDVNGIGQDGSNYKAVLPSGVGSVTASGSLYSIEISWSEVDWQVGANSNKANETKSFLLDFNLTD